MEDTVTQILLVEVPGWAVGMVMVTVSVLKFLWGADMMATETLIRRAMDLPLSGTFWLGIHFLITATGIYGYIGLRFIHTPGLMVPVWVAIIVGALGISGGLAWYFLSRERENAFKEYLDEISHG
jgi:hypothetical protein